MVWEASVECLSQGYQTARDEIQNVASPHSVITVNTDGWSATQTAFGILYPGITIIQWKRFYHFPEAYRTRNMLDRIMKLMKRCIKNAQYFHASPKQATLYMRGFALIHNFSPSSPGTIKKYQGWQSPADRLNQVTYSDDWLINLMMATSLRGYRIQVRNPL